MPRSNFQQIGTSVRYAEFSGDGIDQLIANHLRASGSGADASTVRMGSRRARSVNADAPRKNCRPAPRPPSRRVPARISGCPAQNLEQLISGHLDRVPRRRRRILQRNGIQRDKLAAVAAVGGGASIPLLTTRLSERLQVPIFTTPQPAVIAAIGAAVLASSKRRRAPRRRRPRRRDADGDGQRPSTQPAQTDSPQAGGGANRCQAAGWSQDADERRAGPLHRPRRSANEYGREATGLEDPTRTASPPRPAACRGTNAPRWSSPSPGAIWACWWRWCWR